MKVNKKGKQLWRKSCSFYRFGSYNKLMRLANRLRKKGYFWIIYNE